MRRLLDRVLGPGPTGLVRAGPWSAHLLDGVVSVYRQRPRHPGGCRDFLASFRVRDIVALASLLRQMRSGPFWGRFAGLTVDSIQTPWVLRGPVGGLEVNRETVEQLEMALGGIARVSRGPRFR